MEQSFGEQQEVVTSTHFVKTDSLNSNPGQRGPSDELRSYAVPTELQGN